MGDRKPPSASGHRAVTALDGERSGLEAHQGLSAHDEMEQSLCLPASQCQHVLVHLFLSHTRKEETIDVALQVREAAKRLAPVCVWGGRGDTAPPQPLPTCPGGLPASSLTPFQAGGGAVLQGLNCSYLGPALCGKEKSSRAAGEKEKDEDSTSGLEIVQEPTPQQFLYSIQSCLAEQG